MSRGPASVIVDTTGRIGSFGAFNRFRVGEPFSLFDSKQIYDNNPFFFVTSTATGGMVTYNNAHAASELTTTTTSGSSAIRQTRRYFNYQSGKSFLTLISFNLVGTQANVRKRVGYFDANNGIFLQADDTAVSLVIRTNTSGSPSDANAVAQASWNIDPLDGTGPSGVTLDFTDTQVLVIDFQWLGVGSVRVGFILDGNIVYAHQFNNANTTTLVYMRTPNLPVRWEITNTGTATGTPQLDSICCSVIVEGGVEQLGVSRSASRVGTGISIGTTLTPVLSIRLKSSHARATLLTKKASLITSTGANFYWQIVINPTITGGAAASWSSVSDMVEADTARTGSVSGGVVVDSGYASNNTDEALVFLPDVLSIAADFAGTPDELVLAARRVDAGGNEEFFGALTWLEVL